MVTFYAYYLMSKVLDHCERAGRRHIRFRELSADVFGMTLLLFPLAFRTLRQTKRCRFHFFLFLLSLSSVFGRFLFWDIFLKLGCFLFDFFFWIYFT